MTVYSPFRHVDSVLWKRRPIHLTFFVTRRCNLSCPFCFYLDGAPAWPRGGARELSLTEIERIAASTGDLLWLAFSGGEPFLRDDLADVTRLFYRASRPAIMLYSTNGQAPERIARTVEQVLSECPKSVVVVKVSLDATGDAHDTLRGRRGAFERALRTYRLLEHTLDRYPRLELGVNTVLSAANAAEVDAVIDFVRGLERARSHTISLVRGGSPEGPWGPVGPERYAEVIGHLEASLGADAGGMYRFRGGRLKAAQDVLQRRLIHRTLATGRRVTRCYAGRLSLVLTETGDVYPCERFTPCWGNVRDHDYDLRHVARSGAAKRSRAAIAAGGCHCTHECYAMMNVLFNPRWYPRLARTWMRLRARRRP